MPVLGPLLALLVGASPARPAAPWDGPAFAASPADVARAAAQLPSPGEQSLDVLLEECRLAFDAEGRLTYAYRTVLRPLTRAGADSAARVSRLWHPWREDPPVIRARVVHPDGTAQELDPATLSDGAPRQEPRMYSDTKVRRGPLPGIRAGDVVEVESTVHERAPLFEGGTVVRFAFGNDVLSRRIRLHVEAPTALPLRWLPRGGFAQKPREERAGGVHTLDWDVVDVPAVRPPSSAAPPGEVEPLVAVSTGASWQAVAARYAVVVDERLDGAALADRAREIAGDAPDGPAAAQRLLEWISGRVRYTGLELSEAAIVPARPADVLERGYGDCKDLSTLLVGMLRALGHPADVALLRTFRDDATDLPGVGEFDHAIVHLGGAPGLFVDPTSPETPVGRLPAGDQGKLALVAAAASTGLVRTPEDHLGDSGYDLDTEIALSETGPARASRTVTFRGENAADMRAALRALQPAEILARDVRRVEEIGADGILISVARRGLETPAAALETRYEIGRTRWGWTGQDDAEATCAPDTLLGALPEQLRTEPARDAGKPEDLALHTLFAGRHRYVVTPPPGFQIAATPEPLDLAVGSVRYVRRVERRPDQSVVVTHELAVSSRAIPAAEVERTRKAVLALAREDLRIKFDRTSAVLLRTGKPREALEALRQLVALHPQEARHHAHLALALLQLGMGEPARRAAAAGVERDPFTAYGHRVLALTRASDAMGRWLAPGCDVAGAVAAQRLAVALERGPNPESQLAGYLEAGPTGARFAPGAHLDEALALRRAVRERYGDRSHDGDLLELLIASERYADALALAREAADGRPRRAALIVALTAQQGGKAALAEVQGWKAQDRADATADALKLILRTRAWTAVSRLIEAMEADRSAPPEAALLKRVRRVESLRVDPAEPAAILPRFLQAVFAPLDPAADLDALLAEELRGGPFVPEIARIVAGPAFADLPGIDELPGAALVDVGSSLIQGVVGGDGDDDSGWRIEYTMPGQKDRIVLYAVRQRGSARLLGADTYPGPLGLRAARLLAEGKTAAARRLLSWAAHDSTGESSPGEAVRAVLAHGEGPSELALAAAALSCHAEPTGPAVDRVTRALRETRDPRLIGALTRALATGLASTRRWGELQALAARTAGPDQAEGAFAVQTRALEAQGKDRELRAIAKERLEAHPDDPTARRALATAASIAGQDDEALRLVRAALPARPGAGDYARAAWMGLFLDPPDDTTLDHARRADGADGKRRAGAKRVLAAVRAARGEPAQAMQMLAAASPWTAFRDPEEWLVMGRAAEAYGLPEEARTYYRDAAEDRSADRVTRTLAARWAARLLRSSAGTPPD